MVTNPESRGVQNLWIPGLRASASRNDAPETKTPHCYHLVTIKTAIRIAAFCGNRPAQDFHSGVDRRILVLDLFS
jgi:hypothetical protein